MGRRVLHSLCDKLSSWPVCCAYFVLLELFGLPGRPVVVRDVVMHCVCMARSKILVAESGSLLLPAARDLNAAEQQHGCI